jgi:Uma2 family endonuclease
MNTVTMAPRVSPEDLLTMPDGDRYELVNDQLVERTMSTWASYVAGRLERLLGNFCEQNPQGWVLPEGTSYRCFPDNPRLVRRADGSFIRGDRLTAAQAQEEGHLTIAPDLAAEVLSPNDNAYEIDRKVQAFLAAGTRLVWVINPETRTNAVHRRQGQGVILRENDELSGEDVLPGFHCRVSDLFRLPPGVEPPAVPPAQP